MSELLSVKGSDFAGSARHEGDAINVVLTGNADYTALDSLDMLLGRVHREAQALGIKQAVVDLRELEFMNSSGFRSFVTWLNDIKELDEAHRYTIKVISNPELHWQKRSMHSLRTFAIDLVTIVESA